MSIATRQDARVWQWVGAVDVHFNGKSDRGFLDVIGPVEEGVNARLLGDDAVLDKLSLGSIVALTPTAGSTACWNLSDVQIRSEGLCIARYLELLIPHDRIPANPITGANLHRIVYLPLALPHYRLRIWRGDESGAHGQFFSTFRVFERTFAISEVQNEDSDTNNPAVLSLAWEGGDVVDQELDALDMTLYLLGGRGARRAAREHYDVNGILTAREYDYGTFSLARYEKRLFPIERFREVSLQCWLPELVERIHTAFGDGVPLRPILFHYFSSQIHMPELAMLFLGTSREAMLPKLGNSDTTLLPIADFRTRAARAVAALRDEFDDFSADEVATLLQRFEGLNDVSVGRRRKLLAERTATFPNADEARVLRHRDNMAHSGYILDTTYDDALEVAGGKPAASRCSDRLRDLQKDEEIMRHLVVRTLLRFIGYAGPYIDPRDNSLAALS